MCAKAPLTNNFHPVIYHQIEFNAQFYNSKHISQLSLENESFSKKYSGLIIVNLCVHNITSGDNLGILAISCDTAIAALFPSMHRTCYIDWNEQL